MVTSGVSLAYLRSKTGCEDPEPAYRYHGEYRRTAPPYVAGRGFIRYSSALQHLIPVRPRNKKKRETLGVDEAGLFSFITFSWLTKYMTRAYKKGTSMDDIPQVPPSDSCDYNAQRFVREITNVKYKHEVVQEKQFIHNKPGLKF
ncbi:Multidrug resistance-associated protein 5 [Homalodisca vitripennis]|nr:Multidrug resistance-associated protein 5 [Homalodisca vitripennis]